MAGETGIEIETQMNDPRLEIINIQVTGDPVQADQELPHGAGADRSA